MKKQQLLDDLIRLQQPDEPEWLQRLKVQPEVDLKVTTGDYSLS